MARKLNSPGSASSPTVAEWSDSDIAVLTSVSFPGHLASIGKMHKRFYLDKAGDLKVVPYQKAMLFSSIAVPVAAPQESA